MIDWETMRETEEEVIAKCEGTVVAVFQAPAGSPGAWRWEVRFADGQVQSGHAESQGQALEKGKRVAERFLT